MEYNVQVFPKEEFLRLWDIVLIAREEIPIYSQTAALYRVSDCLEDFCETDRPAATRSDYVGLYYHDGQIWLKPGEFYSEMQDTVLHELAHHEVPHEAHGRTWRKVFGISLALHLREYGFEWDDIESTVRTQVIERYRRFRTVTRPMDKKRIVREEIGDIIRRAENKMSVLTERGRR